MGLFSTLYDAATVTKVCRETFDSKYAAFWKSRPDVKITREYDVRPCPYIVYYITSEGQKYAVFSCNAATHDRQMKHVQALRRDNKLRCSNVTIFPDYTPLNFPWD